MSVKVLIVDDSQFFRKRIEEMLKSEPRIQVVGTAGDGAEAIEKTLALRPDVITMDVEMPGMNGIEAVRQIMSKQPTQVLMLSSLTHEGARITLQALEAGAADYLPKEVSAWISDRGRLQQDLVGRILALGQKRPPLARSLDRSSSSSGSSRSFSISSSGIAEHRPAGSGRDSAALGTAAPGREASGDRAKGSSATSSLDRVGVPDCRIVVIGSSTGGPAALQTVLSELPANFPAPILIVQHMPRTFTQVFAERLNRQCQIEVKEAADGDVLKPGSALLAPGGLQMILDPRQNNRIRVLDGDQSLTYKPSVDVTYASVAKVYGRSALSIILTGMGADGCEGARLLKREGATMWAQSEASCTIYGMPAAVINAGLADAVLDLEDIGKLLAKRGRG